MLRRYPRWHGPGMHSHAETPYTEDGMLPQLPMLRYLGTKYGMLLISHML